MASAMITIFSRYGIPAEVLTDNVWMAHKRTHFNTEGTVDDSKEDTPLSRAVSSKLERENPTHLRDSEGDGH